MENGLKSGLPPGHLRELYYITHVDNVPSILKNGIMSHMEIEKNKIKYTPIYDKDIVSRREGTTTPDGRSLWCFANLYFNPRNPMLYRVVCEQLHNKIAVIGVALDMLKGKDVFLTTGNAAHSQSKIVRFTKKALSQILSDTAIVWWNEDDGSKRKVMAEYLIADKVLSECITSIYVSGHVARDILEKSLEAIGHPPVIPMPGMFFQPIMHRPLTPKLALVQGDMFFSRMQTITISVNTVGIMGKGVASRAKYQFPRVYVEYQEVCRSRQLKMGKPYLYKPEKSFDIELLDEPASSTCTRPATWFLLFPTKRHWRDNADIKGIEEGLIWLRENYKKEGIESLALPALGCGLGRLNWSEVGPLMCEYLYTMNIPASIYLPAEKIVQEEYLTRDFLLPKKTQSNLISAK
jgi:O-acetyl-ADP-ribose deacetylase (regulator of RNase III)